MEFCVIGAGRMGARHAVNIASHERANLRYVVDADAERARALASRYGAASAAAVSEVLGDPSLDAVVICSPTNTHVDLIVAAAKAGKAILCEKPIDLDMGRVDFCAEQIRTLNPRIMIGFQRRFDPTHRAVKDAVDRGEVGKIEVVSIISRDPTPPPLSYIAGSGGQFHDQMIHDFDLALWLTNASGAVQVFAMASNLVDPRIGQAGDSDTAEVLIRFENGSFCRIDCSRRCSYGYDQRVEVFGSAGSVSSGNVVRSAIARSNSSGTDRRDVLLDDFMARYLPTYANELDSFIEANQAGTPLSPDFASGRRALALADAALASSRGGKPVSVSI